MLRQAADPLQGLSQAIPLREPICIPPRL